MIRQLFGRTLVRRVSLGLVSAYAVVYLVLITYAVWVQRSEETDRHGLRNFGTELVRSLAKLSEPGEVRAVVSSMDAVSRGTRQFQKVPGALLLQVWDRQEGQMIFSSPGAGPALLPGDPGMQTRHMLNDSRYSVFLGDTPRWSVRVAETDLTNDLSDSWLWLRYGGDLLPYMLIAFPVLLIPIWFSVSRGLRPLQRLTDQIAARNGNDLSAVGVAPRYDELAPLVRSLDDLLARLRHKVEREHGFVQDAAHELRTPMAVISAQAHVLAKASVVEQRREAGQRLDQAIARGSHLIEQLLALARIDGEHEQQMLAADLAQLARRVLAQRAPGAMDRRVDLSLDAPDVLHHVLDLHAFESVLQNLVDNAIRYNNEGGRVVVTLSGEDGTLRLSVADDGPGIPSPHRALVFERFYRGLGHDASGSGLGLAIVRQAVLRMRGEVDLTVGLEGCGCCFVVKIPMHSVPQA